jgi:hypothetical protein
VGQKTNQAQRKAQTGDVQALPNRPRNNNHKITDCQKFRANALTHGNKTSGGDGAIMAG